MIMCFDSEKSRGGQTQDSGSAMGLRIIATSTDSEFLVERIRLCNVHGNYYVMGCGNHSSGAHK